MALTHARDPTKPSKYPSAGGTKLVFPNYQWQDVTKIPNQGATKIAPFNYQYQAPPKTFNHQSHSPIQIMPSNYRYPGTTTIDPSNYHYQAAIKASNESHYQYQDATKTSAHQSQVITKISSSNYQYQGSTKTSNHQSQSVTTIGSSDHLSHQAPSRIVSPKKPTNHEIYIIDSSADGSQERYVVLTPKKQASCFVVGFAPSV